MMRRDIQIIKKPEWVSWDEIKQCLYAAHAVNRTKGVNMTHYQWSADRIKDLLGEKGVMLVALDGNQVVGTAAICERIGRAWYASGRYAYMCFAGVLPEYSGQGIYKALITERERIAKDSGLDVLLMDTHYRNRLVQNIAKKNGYRYVRFFRASSKDHYCVVMVKWLKGCPFSEYYCYRSFWVSKIKTIIVTFFHFR